MNEIATSIMWSSLVALLATVLYAGLRTEKVNKGYDCFMDYLDGLVGLVIILCPFVFIASLLIKIWS